MKTYKLFIVILLLAFVCYRIFLIASDFSSTRIIEVQKEIYENNEKDYLKGYEIVNVPFEQFDIQVSPKGFFDYLLLTDVNGNLLSIVLEIAAGLWLAWFFYKLDLENISLGYFTQLEWPFLLIAVSLIARLYGVTYTRVFWKSIYKYKGKVDFWQHDFYINTENRYLLYVFILFALLNFYKSVTYYYRKATPISEA